MNIHRGILDGSGLKVAIIVGKFNQFICQSLVDGAVDCLVQHKTSESDIDIFWVPGGFEIPLAAKTAAKTGKYDVIICLGAVIRGATPHFDFVAGNAASGIGAVSLDAEIPVMFGIITTENIEQAIERAGTKAGNKGWDAALSAIEMVSVLKKIAN